MINPYAQAFMIATRTEHVAPPRIVAAKDPKPRKPWFFGRGRNIDPSKV